MVVPIYLSTYRFRHWTQVSCLAWCIMVLRRRASIPSINIHYNWCHVQWWGTNIPHVSTPQSLSLAIPVVVCNEVAQKVSIILWWWRVWPMDIQSHKMPCHGRHTFICTYVYGFMAPSCSVPHPIQDRSNSNPFLLPHRCSLIVLMNKCWCLHFNECGYG